MEELRSTDILDREIQEDARKKAEKLLKAADSDCERIRSESEARLESARAEKAADCDARLEAYRQDSESAIPLEKQRRMVSLVDTSVRAALDSWFKDIGAARRLALYRSKLERYVPNLGTARLRVREIGYPVSDVEALLEGTVGRDRVESVVVLGEAEARVAGFADGLLVETADRSTLCRVTRSEIFEELLSSRRQELAEALFGGRLPE